MPNIFNKLSERFSDCIHEEYDDGLDRLDWTVLENLVHNSSNDKNRHNENPNCENYRGNEKKNGPPKSITIFTILVNSVLQSVEYENPNTRDRSAKNESKNILSHLISPSNPVTVDVDSEFLLKMIDCCQECIESTTWDDD